MQNARRLLARPVLAALGAAATIDRLEESRVNAELVLSELVRNVAEGRIAADSDDIVADDDSLGSRLHAAPVRLGADGRRPAARSARAAVSRRTTNSIRSPSRRPSTPTSAAAETPIDAAKSLDVHVNTVRYRLSRVEPLFGIDLDDAETRLLVWLQLWARHN